VSCIVRHKRWRLARRGPVALLTLVPLLVTLAATAAQRPGAGPALGAYDWPVKPFGLQHPVRGYLNDPRMGQESQTFHTGIDISVARETPVFAVEPGTVRFIDAKAIAVRSGARTLQYWHITPNVRNGQHVRRHALLGQTLATFNHLHLSELLHGRLVNPLRPGALRPFKDSTSPTTSGVAFWQAGTTTETAAVHGTVDIVADSFDTAAGVEPRPWPVSPPLIRWRLSTNEQAGAWHTAVDFRERILPSAQFPLVYAPGTRPDHLGRAGRFRFYLAHRWNSATAPKGTNFLEVAASDIRGNTGVAVFPFDVEN
jgi:Peptidase family M23